MKFITRLRQLIAPPCGHEQQIAELQQELAQRRARIALQSDLIDSLSSAGKKLTAELADERARMKTLKVELAQAMTTFSDASDALEEATARIAVLEQQLRDAGTDEQLALIHAPAVESGGGDCDAKPELVSDTTPEGVFRVVGLFFIDRRYWLLSRDEGKTKLAAAVRDKAFLERLHKHQVTFGDGDSLRVKLNTQTWRRPDGSLFTQYAISKCCRSTRPSRSRSVQRRSPMPEEVIRLEQFSTEELRALSAIALLLNRFTAERQDRMLAYLSQGGPLVPIGGPELEPPVVDEEELPVV